MQKGFPIIMQYRSSESVKHYGGVAVFFNALHSYIESGKLSPELSSCLKAGENLASSALSSLLELLYRSFFYLLSKVDHFFLTNSQIKLHALKSKLLAKAMCKSRKNVNEVLYHHMNNFVLPHFGLFFLAYRYRVVMVTSLIDFLDLDFPEFLSPKIVQQREITRHFLLQYSEVLVPISDFVSDDSVELGADKEKIRIIKWGTNHLSLDPEKSFTAVHKSNYLPTFVLPAKSWAHKGHLEFLRAFLTSSQVNYRLVFVGDTSNINSKIEELLGLYPRHRHLFLNLGFVSDEERNLRFAESQGIILPSVYEGFGFPYFEAAIMSKPLFCFSTKSYLEYFPNCRNPGLAPLFDYELLHSKVLAFDEVEHANAIECMKVAAQRFTWEESCDRLFSLYAEIALDSRKF